jgi:hypothetical protein
MIGFAWTHGYGLLLAIAGGIATIGGAIAVASGGARWLLQQISPSKPLVSFGHPVETRHIPFFFLSDDDAFMDRQHREHEEYRLSGLDVKYLIENKDDVALRELMTGTRTRNGDREHTFSDHYVQILSAGDTTEVENSTIPADWHEGMTSGDLSE